MNLWIPPVHFQSLVDDGFQKSQRDRSFKNKFMNLLPAKGTNKNAHPPKCEVCM